MNLLGLTATQMRMKSRIFIPAIDTRPEELLEQISTAVADTGYFSETTNFTDSEQKEYKSNNFNSKRKPQQFFN